MNSSSEPKGICQISIKLDGNPYQEITNGAGQPVVSIVDLKKVKHTVVFTVTNTSNDVVRFLEYWHGYKRPEVVVTTSDEFHVNQGTAHPIKPGGKYISNSLHSKIFRHGIVIISVIFVYNAVYCAWRHSVVS